VQLNRPGFAVEALPGAHITILANTKVFTVLQVFLPV
jgi:hypothetical protein